MRVNLSLYPPLGGKMNPLFVFLHIPKTGGTSFITFLENNFGKSKVMRYPRGVSTDWNNIDCIHGHVKYDTVEADPDFENREKIYYTLIRNPVDRAISFYWHCNGGEDGLRRRHLAMKEWLSDSKAANSHMRANAYTHYLGSSNSLEALFRLYNGPIHYGFTEAFDEAILELTFLYPNIFKTKKYKVENVTEESKKRHLIMEKLPKNWELPYADIIKYVYKDYCIYTLLRGNLEQLISRSKK